MNTPVQTNKLKDEKAFLMSALRGKYGDANLIPNASDIKAFAEAGHRSPHRLDKVHGYEAIRNFYRQMHKLLDAVD